MLGTGLLYSPGVIGPYSDAVCVCLRYAKHGGHSTGVLGLYSDANAWISSQIVAFTKYADERNILIITKTAGGFFF
jgi:hypothetical protein